jgi:(+)-neomenthol dehydrogenase
LVGAPDQGARLNGTETESLAVGRPLRSIQHHQLEITDPTSAARLAEFVKNKFGKLDVLVRPFTVRGMLDETYVFLELHQS